MGIEKYHEHEVLNKSYSYYVMLYNIQLSRIIQLNRIIDLNTLSSYYDYNVFRQHSWWEAYNKLIIQEEAYCWHALLCFYSRVALSSSLNMNLLACTLVFLATSAAASVLHSLIELERVNIVPMRNQTYRTL